MAGITDIDRTIFAEAYKTLLDNFTESELESVGKIAKELHGIIEAAKQRQRHSSVGQSRGQLNYR